MGVQIGMNFLFSFQFHFEPTIMSHPISPLTMYKLLHRSVRMYMPTNAGQKFATERIRQRFRTHRFETNPKRIDQLMHHAYIVLVASISDVAMKRMESME